MSEWIRIEDRLPNIKAGDNDVSDDVLVLMRHDDGRKVLLIGFYSHGDEEWYSQEGDLQEWHEKTHWMPLPAPPSE